MGSKKSRKKGAARQPRKKKKSSWFSLPKKGQIAGAAAGLVVIAILVFLVWAFVGSAVSPSSEAYRSRQEEILHRHEAELDAFRRQGVVAHEDPDAQEIRVFLSWWETLDRPAQERLAVSAAAVYGQGNCLVLDAATGRRLAWYTTRRGYRELEPVTRGPE